MKCFELIKKSIPLSILDRHVRRLGAIIAVHYNCLKLPKE